MRATIAGPAGALEIQVDLPKTGDPVGVAVVCHPHPQQGGTLDNKVAYTLARAGAQSGLAAYRFNFRGVGASEGSFGDKVGEQDDLRHVVAHARQAHPGLPLTLMGFSFGGWIALSLADELDAARLITIAPPLWYFGDAQIIAPRCPWTLVHGLADEVVDAAQSRAVMNAMEHPPKQHWLPDVGHFFHGQLTDLRAILRDELDQHTG